MFGSSRATATSATFQQREEAPKSITDKAVRRLGIDVDDHFEPVWVVPDNKKDHVRPSRRR